MLACVVAGDLPDAHGASAVAQQPAQVCVYCGSLCSAAAKEGDALCVRAQARVHAAEAALQRILLQTGAALSWLMVPHGVLQCRRQRLPRSLHACAGGSARRGSCPSARIPADTLSLSSQQAACTALSAVLCRANAKGRFGCLMLSPLAFSACTHRPWEPQREAAHKRTLALAGLTSSGCAIQRMQSSSLERLQRHHACSATSLRGSPTLPASAPKSEVTARSKAQPASVYRYSRPVPLAPSRRQS